MNDEKMQKMAAGRGFIAALDQSGGSTPKAQNMYGIPEESYSGEDEMVDRIQEMRARIGTSPGFALPLVEHPKVLKVVALSGGYNRDEANARLARNHGIVASFSRALTEGLTALHSDEEFNAQLDASIESIYRASIT